MTSFRQDVIDSAAALLAGLNPEDQGYTKEDVATLVASALGKSRQVHDIILRNFGGWATITAEVDLMNQSKAGTYTYGGVRYKKADLRLTVGDGQNTLGGEVMFLTGGTQGMRWVTMVAQGTARKPVLLRVSPTAGHTRTTEIGFKMLERSLRIREVQAKSSTGTQAERFAYEGVRIALRAHRQFNKTMFLFGEYKGGRATDVDVMNEAMQLQGWSTDFVNEMGMAVGWLP